MDTDNDKRNYDRDQNQQSNDRDQNQQDKDRDQNQRGTDGGQNQDQQRSSNEDRSGNRNPDKQGGNSRNTSRDINSQWNDIESDYRRRYPNLTDDDVNNSSGNYDSMTDRIAKRTNRNRQEVDDEIRNWNS